jgi:hypothetical protein
MSSYEQAGSEERPHFQEIRPPHFGWKGKVFQPTSSVDTPFNFNPHDNRLVNPVTGTKLRITELPNQPAYLLRWLSDRYFTGGRQFEADLSERIVVARQHHDTLGALGILTPDYRHVLIGNDPDHDDAVALFTIIEKLTFFQAASMYGAEFQQQRIFQPIADYYAWVRNTEQPHVLTDLVPNHPQFEFSRQFVVKPTSSKQEEVYLLDIEPLVSPATPDLLAKLQSQLAAAMA